MNFYKIHTLLFQNTYTNAEKLLAAAAEMAQTGECNAEDIYSVARELESHISSFAQRVEQRRRLLETAILFYSHTEEVRHYDFMEFKAQDLLLLLKFRR